VRRCCSHAKEIAELRGELVGVRAQVEELARAMAGAGQAGPVVVRAPAVQEPTAQLPAQGRPAPAARPGGALPYADRSSLEAAKVALYRALFAGREDVFAYRWANVATGEKGWAPRRVPGSAKEDAQFLPLTHQVIAEHLTDSPQAIGLYVLLPDSTCRLL